MKEFITQQWVQILMGLAWGIIALPYRHLYKKLKHEKEEEKRKRDEEAAEQALIKEGLLAMLHDRLYQSCRFYLRQGTIDVEGMKNIEYLYRSYHDLGGNGTGTELHTRVKALPINERED